jgi:hypothetical protein
MFHCFAFMRCVIFDRGRLGTGSTCRMATGKVNLGELLLLHAVHSANLFLCWLYFRRPLNPTGRGPTEDVQLEGVLDASNKKYIQGSGKHLVFWESYWRSAQVEQCKLATLLHLKYVPLHLHANVRPLLPDKIYMSGDPAFTYSARSIG